MGLSLTKQDVFELINNNDSLSRLAVTKKICDGYNESLYASDELDIAHEIMRLLARDAEITIRATLSEALKLSNDLPHDVALALAKDVNEVALPMLEFSQILTDTDLLDIIYSADVQKLLSISRRKWLKGHVAKKLIDKDIQEVVESIFTNQDFVENKTEFENFIENCADNETIIQRIINNATLPITVTEKLLTELSSNILHEIRAKYNITPARFDKYVSHSLEISTLSVIDHTSSGDEIDYLVTHLFNYNRLTPSLVLSAACMGKKRFFLSALAKRAGIPKSNVMTLIEKGGKDGLNALLRRAGIPDKLFEAVELVVALIYEKKTNEPEIDVKDFCTWLINRLEYFSEKKDIEYLTYMIAIAKQSQKMKVMNIY